MWELPSWQSYYGLAPSDWPFSAGRSGRRSPTGRSPATSWGRRSPPGRRFRHLGFAFADGAGTLLKPLAWQGDMSFGPPRDGHATFQRLDTNPRWAGVPDLDEAGLRAVEAYVRAYGPATPDHVHYWLGEGLGAGRKRIRSWLAGVGDRLAEVEIDGAPAPSCARISTSWPRRRRRPPADSCRDTTSGCSVRARPMPTSCRRPGGRWSAAGRTSSSSAASCPGRGR